MKHRVCFLSVSLATVAALLLPIPTLADKPGPPGQEQIGKAVPAATVSPMGQAAKARIESSYGKLPLRFEPNQGQSGGEVKFLSRGRGYALFLTNDEAVLVLGNPAGGSAKDGGKAGTSDHAIESTVLRMKLAGANQSARVIGLDELPGKSNYLIGKNPKNWRTNLPNFAKVQYQHVYPGIDLVYYGHQRQLEYDFVVAPGADPAAITLEISGEKGLSPATIAENGDLVIKTDVGELRFHKPIVYQPEDSKAAAPSRKTVEGRFVLLAENRIGFEVPSYDATKPLYIDPEISYGTFLGGGGWEAANDITVDGEGNAYVTGTLYDSHFPVTPGAYDSTCGTESDGLCNSSGSGGTWFSDAFVTKLSSDGASIIYSTYLGGSHEDSALGIAIDTSGNAIVTGGTNSPDFPTVNPFQEHPGGGLCDTPQGGMQSCNDGFVAKLNTTGSALIYSTYLGGSHADSGTRVAVDSSGSAYLVGVTHSADFPTLNALQSVFGGGTCGAASNGDPIPCPDVFVAKISAVGAAVYSTYLGGSRDDSSFQQGIAVDGAGSAYVTSATSSPDFPVTAGAFQTQRTGPTAFVSKLSPSGTSLAYSTYLGGSLADLGLAIAVDESGSAYVTGLTHSQDFPTTTGAFDTSCGTDGLCNGMYDGYVAKLNPDGSALVYSTYLGGSGGETPQDIVVDSLGIAYVTGATDSLDFPETGYNRGPRPGICTNDQVNYYPCPDAFISKLSVDGDGLIVSGYLAGSSEDVGLGIALDSSRNVYIAGRTSSTDFPTTEGAYLTTYPAGPGLATAFVLKLSDLARSRTEGSAESLDFGEQLVGTTSEPQTVTFKNFGDAPEILPPFDVTGDFQMTHTCGESIAPNTSCTADFTFTPQEVGTRTGEFVVYVEDEWQSAGLSLTGVGVAPLVSLSATSLAFASQAVGSSGDPQTVNLSNSGTYPLTVTEIAVSGDFTQTNDCGASVAIGSSCVISVQFSPLAAGDRSGQLTIQGNDPDSPHVVSLSGTAVTPAVTLAPTSLTFAAQALNSTSAAQTVTLTNNGSTGLTINGITITGANSDDFAETHTCGASVATGGNCTISVTFTPTASGSRTASLSIDDSASGSPHTVALSGTGGIPDFSISADPTSTSVTAGGSASHTLTVTPSNGFNQEVSFSCSGLPSLSSCSFSPPSVTPSGSKATTTLTISTTATTTSKVEENLPPGASRTRMTLALAGIFAFLFSFGGFRKRGLHQLWILVALVMLGTAAACGGGSSSKTTTPGTPSGTHAITIAATSGSGSSMLTHTTNLTLTVQ